MNRPSMLRALHILLVAAGGAVLFAMGPGCKAIIDGGGYEVVEEKCGATSPRPDDALVKSCVFTTSCTPFKPPWTISDCITWNLQAAFGGAVSASSATSCQEVWKNTGKGFVDAPGMCDSQPNGWHCEDNKAVYCDSSMGTKKGYYRDCDVLGGSCSKYTEGSAEKADCQLVGKCTEAAGAYHCDGNVLYKCVNEQRYGQNCSQIASSCSASGSVVDCYYEPSTLCQGAIQPCVDNVAHQCTESGGLLKYSCTEAGLECKSAGKDGVCVPRGCAPGQLNDCKEGCDGDVMTVCVGGQSFKLLCVPLGFSGCAVRTLSDRSEYAVCVF
jgi:hypothetical protein